jgi:RimJ/RimL family protein N-acetyltransferase
MKSYISKIDSDRFGFPIAKVNDFTNDPDLIIETLERHGVKLIITRIESSNFHMINYLETKGFLLKDFQLTYNYNIKREFSANSTNNQEYILKDVDENDIEEIAGIAKKAFCNYGHYFADERLDKNKCMQIYEDWAKRSCTSKEVADKVIIAKNKNRVLGFLSFKIYNDSNGKYAAGGLGAVLPEYQNLGIFKTINIEGINWGNTISLNRIEHKVLAYNYPVIKVYEKLGFNILKSELTFHYWIE